MACQAKIIEDSISGSKKRITTFQLRYWRAIHAEFMTHRMFSRNASSSRAIPVQKMIDQVLTDPAGPVHWGANQAGMQAAGEVGEREKRHAQDQWKRAASDAALRAENLMAIGIHKQVANRLLEPFQYISVVVTSTEWENFFNLRCHPDAQPEIQELANAMCDAMLGSIPALRCPTSARRGSLDHWHLPYITQQERELKEFRSDPTLAASVSSARCARVSHLKHDGGQPDIDEDLSLFDRLVGSTPLHASPCEHPARALHNAHSPSGNFFGWAQFRKAVEHKAMIQETLKNGDQTKSAAPRS